MASPGDRIEIAAPVRNVGWWDVSYTEVYFAYDGNPYDPAIEPVIIDVVILEDIVVGGMKVATAYWDTSGLESTTYPIYLAVANSRPVECEPRYFTVDYIVPVRLLEFEANPGDGHVALSWTTVTEVNNLGFHVYRSETPLKGYERISANLIPGAGTSFDRNEYGFNDAAVTNGNPFFYRLAAVSSRGDLDWSWTVAGVPNAHDWNIILHTWTDRTTYSGNQAMSLHAMLNNAGPAAVDVNLQIAVVIDDLYIGDLLSPSPIHLPAGFEQADKLFAHDWLGCEPVGIYQFVTAITEQRSGELIAIDVADITYRGMN